MNNKVAFFNIKKSLILLISFSCLFANARVAFSRPGSTIRLPGESKTSIYNQYSIGFSGEATHFSDLNYSSAAYIQAKLVNGYTFGLTHNTNPEFLQSGVSSTTSNYLSFHLHKRVFKGNNITINLGVHDMLYTAKTPHRVSLFSLFSYAHTINQKYRLDCSFGFGTGSISADSHNYTSSNLASGNEIFLGLRLYTPILKASGGLQFLMEFDGGLHVGTSIPISPSFTLNVGITNAQNISSANEWTQNNSIVGDAPALALGMQVNIPKAAYHKPRQSVKELSNIYNQIPYDASVDSLVNHATFLISTLEDSLNLQNQSYGVLANTNQLLSYRINVLEDSLGRGLLDDKIDKRSLNKAMKLLSQSLNAYYNEQFQRALEKTDQAIKIFPELAVSYARKGSIYYRLGDEKRATINWNLALKLDPEYDEVRAVLLDVKDNININFKKLPE